MNTKTSGAFTIPTDLLEGNENYARNPKATDWAPKDLWNPLNAKMVAANVVVNNTDAIDLSKQMSLYW